jgi:hypothetical protein
MLVRDDWDKVKVGDRVRFTSGGGDAFEGTVTKRGRKWGSYGNIEGAAFDDNVTYKLDGKPRKNSAKVRRDQMLYGNRVFEIVAARTYPTTFGELTDEHIGMRFQVSGLPPMEGTYEGPDVDSGGDHRFFAKVRWTAENYQGREWEAKNSFSQENAGYGYFAEPSIAIEYVSGGETRPQEGVDIDAKLAAYFNQELDKAMKTGRGVHARTVNRPGYGETIVKIMKRLTE